MRSNTGLKTLTGGGAITSPIIIEKSTIQPFTVQSLNLLTTTSRITAAAYGDDVFNISFQYQGGEITTINDIVFADFEIVNTVIYAIMIDSTNTIRTFKTLNSGATIKVGKESGGTSVAISHYHT